MNTNFFATAVADYHDFDEVVRHFANASIELEYAEVGCGTSHLWNGPHGGYHAVFWVKGTTRPSNLINEWKEFFSDEIN